MKTIIVPKQMFMFANILQEKQQQENGGER